MLSMHRPPALCSLASKPAMLGNASDVLGKRCEQTEEDLCTVTNPYILNNIIFIVEKQKFYICY